MMLSEQSSGMCWVCERHGPPVDGSPCPNTGCGATGTDRRAEVAADASWQNEDEMAANIADMVRAARSAPAEARLREIANGLERDRREPDKVLTYVSALRRAAIDMRDGRL